MPCKRRLDRADRSQVGKIAGIAVASGFTRYIARSPHRTLGWNTRLRLRPRLLGCEHITTTYRRPSLMSGTCCHHSWMVRHGFGRSGACRHFQEARWRSRTGLYFTFDILLNILMLLSASQGCGCSSCGLVTSASCAYLVIRRMLGRGLP